MDIKRKYITLLEAFHINTKLRYNHFMAQIEHESGLRLVREDTYYKTIAQAKGTFYTPFKGKSDKFVLQYLRRSEKMANYVYANRMGNGDEASGDGWKYRAGGFLGITGKSNFIVMSKDTRIDYLENPDLLLNEADALISALWYWNKLDLNKHADANDIDAVSDIVNIGRETEKYGDSNGFEDRRRLLAKYEAMDY